MKLISWAVKKQVSVLMLVAFILLMGFVALFKLSIDLLPKINVPVAVVNTRYPGAGPLEIEALITRPLEEAVAMVHNMKRVTSVSAEGYSMIIIEFNDGTNMDFATLEMREKIDLIKNYLPEDAMAPMVLKIDPNALPIMLIGVSGKEELSHLKELAEVKLKPRLERLVGVASVSITGGYDEIIEINVDPQKLSSYGLTLQQLASLLRAENINLPIGEITDGNVNKLIRTVGEFTDLEEIKGLPIPTPLGAMVELNNIADVALVNSDRLQIVKMNGEESIRLTLQKQPVANTVQVANRVNAELHNLREELEGIKVEPIIDQSLYIKKAIGNVAKTAIYGGILAVLVLYIFLRSIKTTTVIALAIPISVICTFALMYFSGITLNILSLGGFALGVGMLVDNGIVVIENIHRFSEEGSSAEEASIAGAQEVAMAVSASTLTTIAVFLPIVFVEGMTAQIFRELALTVTYSLLASLLISLTLVPMLASRMMDNENTIIMHKSKVSWFSFFDGMFDSVLSFYRRLLSWSLFHRKSIIATSIALFIAAGYLLTIVGAEYFPEFDEGTFNIDIRLPHGANLEDTEELTKRVEELASQHPEVEVLFTNIGGGDGMFVTDSLRANRATIDGRLVPQRERKMSTAEVIDKLRKELQQLVGAEITITSSSSIMMAGFGGSAIEVEIRGDDLELLKGTAEDFIKLVEVVEGTREVESNFSEGRPQLEMRLKREEAARYGLQSVQVASIVRGYLEGIKATSVKLDGRETSVIVRGEEYLKSSLGNFLQVPIPTPLGITVPFQQIGELRESRGPNAIRRTDQVRSITVSAAIINRDLNSVVLDIEKKLETYSLPEGFSYYFRGQREQLIEAFGSLYLVVILAIILVYMILASLFQSFIHPFTIMFSVPLAFTGAAIGLFVTGRPISVPGLIGAVVLAGIVVNNGIVLIDYINLLRHKGIGRAEAILEAGQTRVRPILMTTFTTVLGLLPLAKGYGEGAEAQAPMATVVIGGLLSATLLTLVVIPVIYSLFDDLMIKLKHS